MRGFFHAELVEEPSSGDPMPPDPSEKEADDHPGENRPLPKPRRRPGGEEIGGAAEPRRELREKQCELDTVPKRSGDKGLPTAA